MEAEKLMIGDYVMLDPQLKEYYEFAGKPCMVCGLNDEEGAIKFYSNTDGDWFWTDNVDDVMPVPLTEDILHKIGLVRQLVKGDVSKGYEAEHYYWISPQTPNFYNMDASTRLHVSPIVYDPRPHGQSMLYLDSHYGRIEVRCDYLHELQHAYRMAEFSEIVLEEK